MRAGCRFLTAPVVRGAHNLPSPLGPKKPILFVGNHTLTGLYDLPFLVYELYLRGFRARGLAHPAHWQTPLGPFFKKFGAVQASPLAAYKLLRDKEAVLLFPGGAREVGSPSPLFSLCSTCKPSLPAMHQLIWDKEGLPWRCS